METQVLVAVRAGGNPIARRDAGAREVRADSAAVLMTKADDSVTMTAWTVRSRTIVRMRVRDVR